MMDFLIKPVGALGMTPTVTVRISLYWESPELFTALSLYRIFVPVAPPDEISFSMLVTEGDI
jgi:hypothetical protein